MGLVKLESIPVRSDLSTYLSIAVNFVQNDVFVGKLLVERQLAGVEDQVRSVDVASIITRVEQFLVRRVHEYALRTIRNMSQILSKALSANIFIKSQIVY